MNIIFAGLLNGNKISDHMELSEFMDTYPEIPINTILASKEAIYAYEKNSTYLLFYLRPPFEKKKYKIETTNILVVVYFDRKKALVEISQDFTRIIHIYKLKNDNINGMYLLVRGSTKIDSKARNLKNLAKFIKSNYIKNSPIPLRFY